MHIRFHDAIAELPAAAWDALRGEANPFVSHAFLRALEDTGCIRPDWGWQAHHLGLYDDDRLVAAAPLYLKGNSHGEFVFDWSWASAWERAGGEYYPKLLCGVPYSPVPGPRLLADTPARQRALVEAMRGEATRLGLSSVHANFLQPAELAAFDDSWLVRSDVQFHWHNRDYRHFPAFLTALNHKKRKNILHERAQVAASGLAIEWRSGDTLDEHEWDCVHALYEATFDDKGNHAVLTAAFFRRLGELGPLAQLALARAGDEIVAMALFVQGGGVLYGRYWGTLVDVPGLHFELCYYRGIEYAIAQGLQRFEPGAQGEHKLARGFLPARTHSRHWLAHPGFRAVVASALAREAPAMDAYAEELRQHSPYARHGEAAP
ncbi:GNAT family N-acetyltransferase [Rhodanobacter lindaniclasticus]|jgi:predicted N-acyltransferase|uniref:GNAT family N-acetyltransferase n=1 Tax=Rhodanobacter lindaniclasticus TaxID=75310 RepID=A0A4S3K8E8_9GAMM|nr:GNAT family N-acetyltransferase [Rhodanobacter lindaniclasticus]THD04368.1 GNAT family N-acetyltransferase [Rhodanobacter lindaniclasticus]